MSLEYDRKKIILHEKYNAAKVPHYLYDIALVKLDAPVTFDNKLRPVCLWNDTFKGKSFSLHDQEVAKTNPSILIYSSPLKAQ